MHALCKTNLNYSKLTSSLELEVMIINYRMTHYFVEPLRNVVEVRSYFQTPLKNKFKGCKRLSIDFKTLLRRIDRLFVY